MKITIASIVDKDPDLATWAAKLTKADREYMEARINDPLHLDRMVRAAIRAELERQIQEEAAA